MKKIIIQLVIPFLLFLFGVFASLALNTISFSTLSYLENLKYDPSNPTYSLSEGKKIKGRFVARENNLGIITIKLTKDSNAKFYGSEYLLFRIKEESASEWFHESKLLVGKYEQTWTLPIGLPIIINSGGKSYVFELISPNENGDISLKVAGINPKFNTVYKMSFSDISRTPQTFSEFFLKKLLYSFSDLNFVVSSVLYFTPFFFYTLALYLRRQVGIKSSFSYVVLMLILIDIFMVSQLYPGLAPVLLGTWVIAIKFNRLESSVSFMASLCIVLILLLLVVAGFKGNQNVTAFYAYGLLSIGAVQALIETRKRKVKPLTYKQFFQKILKRNE